MGPLSGSVATRAGVETWWDERMLREDVWLLRKELVASWRGSGHLCSACQRRGEGNGADAGEPASGPAELCDLGESLPNLLLFILWLGVGGLVQCSPTCGSAVAGLGGAGGSERALCHQANVGTGAPSRQRAGCQAASAQDSGVGLSQGCSLSRLAAPEPPHATCTRLYT